MRPASLSAKPYGVLWMSSLIIGAFAQAPPQSNGGGDQGGPGASTSTLPSTTTTTNVATLLTANSSTSATPSIDSTESNSATPSGHKTGSKTGAIAGGVVGGVVVVVLIVVGVFLLRRRRKSNSTRDAFGGLEKNRESSSPSVYPSPPPQSILHATSTPIQPISYDSPTSASSQSVAPGGETHALMSSHLETQHPSGEVVPVVGAQRPYLAGTTEREVDEDGVSLRSPSPALPEGAAEQGRDYVPRLPIYNRGSDESPRTPAL